jgi:hypothetical protein
MESHAEDFTKESAKSTALRTDIFLEERELRLLAAWAAMPIDLDYDSDDEKKG